MTQSEEILQGNRFKFGENWTHFLKIIDEERIDDAEESLKEKLCVETLANLTFLDAGSGSGLSSLAACRLGARVHSFDYDPQSVSCTRELKRRYFPNNSDWTVEEGSVLDASYMHQLGKFDVVYSWGVLHHTGAMWVGIEHAISRVKEGGRLFIAIYNDQGWKSHLWWFIKMIYNKLPQPVNSIYAYFLCGIVMLLNIAKYTIKLKPMQAIAPLINYKKNRGMSLQRDLIDWIGGFPFEFVKYDVLRDYMQSRGFEMVNSKPASSLGCHEMVFRLH